MSRLAPYRKPSSGLWFGRDRDKIRILGDIVSPMPPEWYEKADDSDDELVLILLDTHVLIWLRLGDRRLGERARGACERALLSGDAAVSAISFWEVGMQIRKGRLESAGRPGTLGAGICSTRA